ncbi:MATE family efflux transporter [Anaerocolumna sedimenticola]|uniref:MATE family efflux transporter n=1 Tax=Anaerocolumna sedimenticola TaxID=2696063 RepID=A0A6P1TIC4_9FIRM|nr:MATE family efflux transporter [Anaerocolumna sedimenticola]QHQ60960.1 MATE family efflux transporter [Anaerocolumna sedimenticola]
MTYVNDRDEKRAFYKLVFSLVLPMTLQNLINVGVTSIDVIMLGKVSETALSGASLAGQVQFIMTLIFFGLTSGAAVLTAQYWGKKDILTIEKVLGITMRFALVVAVIFTLAVLLFPAPIMGLFTSEETVLNEGVHYLKIISISYIFVSITMIYLNIMRSVERVVVSTVVYLVSLIVNVILASILIFGLFGIEPMGIRGAAIATLVSRIVEFVIVVIYSTKINREIKFHIKNLFIKDKILMKDFLTFAFPVMLNELIWGAGTSTNAAIIGHLGSPVVAANSVTQVTRQLAMVVAFGLANATAIILGKAIGEQKEELAKVYAKRFIRLTLIVGVIGAGVILGVSGIAQSQLTLSTEAKEYLKIMMFVMSYFAIGQAYNTTMVVGVFRAGGDTKFGLILDFSTLWGCSILFGALAAFVWKLPIPIVYMIIMSDEIIKIPLTTLRYKSFKWVRNVTRG